LMYPAAALLEDAAGLALGHMVIAGITEPPDMVSAAMYEQPLGTLMLVGVAQIVIAGMTEPPAMVSAAIYEHPAGRLVLMLIPLELMGPPGLVTIAEDIADTVIEAVAAADREARLTVTPDCAQRLEASASAV